MVALARQRLAAAGLGQRTVVHQGYVDDLPASEPFAAATLIGVLHHLPGEPAKRAILAAIAARLRPGAPLILAGNYRPYASEPLLLAAWRQRWRTAWGDTGRDRGQARQDPAGRRPPGSEQAVADLLTEAGFEPPTRFFASLFWGAWLARRHVTVASCG